MHSVTAAQNELKEVKDRRINKQTHIQTKRQMDQVRSQSRGLLKFIDVDKLSIIAPALAS